MEGIRNEMRGFMSFDPEIGYSDLGGVSVFSSPPANKPRCNNSHFLHLFSDHPSSLSYEMCCNGNRQ